MAKKESKQSLLDFVKNEPLPKRHAPNFMDKLDVGTRTELIQVVRAWMYGELGDFRKIDLVRSINNSGRMNQPFTDDRLTRVIKTIESEDQ